MITALEDCKRLGRILELQYQQRKPWKPEWLSVVLALLLEFIPLPVYAFSPVGRYQYGYITTTAVVLLSLLTAILLIWIYGLQKKIAKLQLTLEEEQTFTHIFRVSPAAIGITRMSDGALIDGNQSLEEMFGYTREEAIEYSIIKLGIWDDPNERKVILEQLKKEGTIKNSECKLRAKDGHLISVRYSGELIILDGEVCILSVFLDITERKRVEEEYCDILR